MTWRKLWNAMDTRLTTTREVLPDRVWAKAEYIPKRLRQQRGHVQEARLPDEYVKKVCKVQNFATLDDVKERALVKTRLSRANAMLDTRLGGDIEYRRMAVNYDAVVGVLGTQFPFHPSYLCVFDVVCEFYQVKCLDVLTYPASMHALRKNEGGIGWHTATRQRAMRAYKCLCYLLMDVFKFAVPVIADIFSTAPFEIQESAAEYERKLTVRLNCVEHAEIISRINDVL